MGGPRAANDVGHQQRTFDVRLARQRRRCVPVISFQNFVIELVDVLVGSKAMGISDDIR